TGCGERAVKIVGTCRYCSANFCSRHRLPEAHACSNLQGCRDESIAKLEHKLIGEKCVASKV
ncbi:nuclear protein, partial [Caulochytrium protostelioides]